MFESMNFQKWIIVIFTIILVIILIYLGMNINKPDTSILWPPITANCPDYWADVNGNGTYCMATKDSNTDGIGVGVFNALSPPTSTYISSSTASGYVSDQTNTTTTYNFAAAPYIGSNGLCEKYKWATTTGVAWDGITYGVTNPCN